MEKPRFFHVNMSEHVWSHDDESSFYFRMMTHHSIFRTKYIVQ